MVKTLSTQVRILDFLPGATRRFCKVVSRGAMRWDLCFSKIILVVARGETGSRETRKEAIATAQEGDKGGLE